MNYKDRLPSREEIEMSLRNYSNINATIINLLPYCSDTYKIFLLSQKTGRTFKSLQNYIERYINDFVNIYGYIYLNGYFNKINYGFYRGTNKREVSEYKKGAEILKFFSVTTNQDIAKSFMGSEYAFSEYAFIYIDKGEGIPSVTFNDFKNGNQENEHLIAPFTKVKNIVFLCKYKGISYYSIELERQELPEIKDIELQNLKTKVISEFSQYVELVNEYNKAEENYDYYSKIIPLPYDTVLAKRINDNTSKYNEVKEKLKILETDLVTLLKGLCRQREKDIDERKKDLEEQRKAQIKKSKEEMERAKISDDKKKRELIRQNYRERKNNKKKLL